MRMKSYIKSSSVSLKLRNGCTPACRHFHKMDASGEPEWLTPAWLSEEDIDVACDENWLVTGASLDYIYCNGCGNDWPSFEELENAGGLVEIDESEFDNFLQEC